MHRHAGPRPVFGHCAHALSIPKVGGLREVRSDGFNQPIALLLTEILKRCPRAAEGIDPSGDLTRSTVGILDHWMISLGAQSSRTGISLTVHETDAVQLEFGFESEYEKEVMLQPLCGALERAVPGLGGQLVRTLDEINYQVADIITPLSVFHMYSHVHWYCEETDDGVRQMMADMGADDEDMTLGEFFPSDYWRSIGQQYSKWVARGPHPLWSFKKLREQTKHAPAWARDVAQGLIRLRQLQRKVPQRDVLAERLSAWLHGSQRPMEPSFAFWWNDNPLMGNAFQEVVNYRWEDTEEFIDGLISVRLTTVASVVETLDWIERALPFLKELEAFRLGLWRKQHEKRRRHQGAPVPPV